MKAAPVETAEDLSAIAFGFMASKALFTGLHVDLFTLLADGPKTAEELAEAAGLAIENGIRTDRTGRTSAPNVWAAGDCASFPYRGAQLRLESKGLSRSKIAAWIAGTT